MLELILVAAVAVAVAALFLALVRFVRANVPPGAISEAWAWLFQTGPRGLGKGWYVAAVVLMLLVAVNLNLNGGEELLVLMGLLSLVVLGLFLHTWRREFVFLMGLRDDDFPGSFDK